jgi:sporulation protein YlmC with PRC-barrel domain
MRLSDLRDKKVRTDDGKTLGRVHEVHADKGRIVALMCGGGSFIERWTGKTDGRRIPWEDVVRVEKKQVVVKSSASASRSRKGTPRPSAPPSKR